MKGFCSSQHESRWRLMLCVCDVRGRTHLIVNVPGNKHQRIHSYNSYVARKLWYFDLEYFNIFCGSGQSTLYLDSAKAKQGKTGKIFWNLVEFDPRPVEGTHVFPGTEHNYPTFSWHSLTHFSNGFYLQTHEFHSKNSNRASRPSVYQDHKLPLLLLFYNRASS